MWKCEWCGDEIDDELDECAKCAQSMMARKARPTEPPWRLNYRVFRGTWASWESLFNDAATFASQLGRDRVVGISHSADHSEGIVTVWYWDQATGNPSAGE